MDLTVATTIVVEGALYAHTLTTEESELTVYSSEPKWGISC